MRIIVKKVKTMKNLNKSLLCEKLIARAENDLSEHNISGASLIVKQCGKTVFRRHFGTSSPVGSDPVTDDTLFRLASMTKPITSVAVMSLYERGKLDLYDPIEKYLPQFADRYTAEVTDDGVRLVRPVSVKPTILHLLTHTSGLLNGKSGEYYLKAKTKADDLTLDSVVELYSKLGLEFEPFSQTQYNGTAAFDLLAKIIEVLTDKPYEDYLRETIFEPCGMVDTTFVPSDEQWKRLITMHNKVDGKAVVFDMKPGCVFESTPVTHPLGGAGLISSLDDYSAFSEMLLNNGIGANGRVLSALAVRMISTPHVPKAIMGGPVQWGLGVRVITGSQYKRLDVGTYGWSGAYGTHFFIDPENRITAVYLKNAKYDGGAGSRTGMTFECDVHDSMQ